MLSKIRMASLGIVAAAMFAAAAAPAQAQSTASGNLTVTANVTKNCVVSATTLAFGDYDPTATSPLDRDGTVTLRCTKGTAARIDLGNVGSRRMTSATTLDNLLYELYSDSGRNTVWGAGVNWTAGSSGNTNVTVYGRVPAQQDVAAANNYTQTISVTVTY